jgi:glycosyltransferase involved in cell wall biosynthesis
MISSARYGLSHEWLRGVIRAQAYDLAWFEFIQSASLLPLLPPSLPSRLVVHDFFFQAHERKATQAAGIARIFWQWEARRTKRWESLAISRAKEVVTLTEKDKEVAQAITGRRDIGVRYPEVDEVFHDIGRTRGPRVAKGTILFWGQMSRRENEDAAIWFVRDILPSIRLRRPGAKLIIAGANPGPSVLKLASGNVEVTGFVADPVGLFHSAEVAIAPLRLGAGIKIKVAEYLAAGIPTVVTTVGAEGIKHSRLLRIADRPADFSEACIALMAPQLHE